jgi:hypothetical protein
MDSRKFGIFLVFFLRVCYNKTHQTALRTVTLLLQELKPQLMKKLKSSLLYTTLLLQELKLRSPHSGNFFLLYTTLLLQELKLSNSVIVELTISICCTPPYFYRN